jgi:hypothetical protein
MSADFKFVVLTLANRNAPGTFQAKEIGKLFEYFDEARRLLIIKSMNEIARWGKFSRVGFQSTTPNYLSN